MNCIGYIGKNKGFTMLELLITLAILAILSTVAIPSLVDTLGRMSVNSGARNLVGTLNLARSEAVRRSQDVSICPTANGLDCAANNWTGGWIVFVDNNNDADGDTGSIDAGDTVIRVIEPLADLNLSFTPAASLLVYDNKGFGKNTLIYTFKVCPQDGNIDNAKQVEISLSGRARTTDGVLTC
ncbi:MAG: GspH/FimT family pseudopilin [Gammaproteobacteria bacterium]|nr:GspH/FimT family pseudopilin [Gammaproteobacteria bacterium]